jgi:hypothetical protein
VQWHDIGERAGGRSAVRGCELLVWGEGDVEDGCDEDREDMDLRCHRDHSDFASLHVAVAGPTTVGCE